MGGCMNQNSNRKIVALMTSSKEKIYISTQDINSVYTLKSTIGTGSFGQVMIGRMNCNPAKQFAIKVVPMAKLNGKDSIFANEIYILRLIDHPNIVKFHEVYQNNEYYYLCMDYCSGGELSMIKYRTQHLSEKIMQTLAYKILSAVSYMHKKGIVHRDLKPSNILFPAKDLFSEPKLIDFGLSGFLKSGRKFDRQVGTPKYMAPEVITGNYNEKCDIWSLGVMFFKLLVGSHPFYCNDKMVLFSKIQTQQISFKHKSWGYYSPSCQDLIKQMLNKNPVKRLSAKECLKHPWFQMTLIEHSIRRSSSIKIASTYDSQGANLYDQLSKAAKQCEFKQELQRMFVNQFDENDLQAIKVEYLKLDPLNLGVINFQSLSNYVHCQGTNVGTLELRELLLQVNRQKEEEQKIQLYITYSDFITMHMNRPQYLNSHNARKLFNYFDIAKKGFITITDIQDIFVRNGKYFSEKKISNLLKEYLNETNKLSFPQFCSILGLAVHEDIAVQQLDGFDIQIS